MEVFRPSPRQADLMIVAGRVSQKMAPVLRQIYDQMPDPKWVLAMGVCASSGGMFNNYAIVQGVDHIVPVDMYLPGCPPRPEMLIDAILKLHDKIMDEPLGAKRAAALAEREKAELVPSSIKSSRRRSRLMAPDNKDVQTAPSPPAASTPRPRPVARTPRRTAPAGGETPAAGEVEQLPARLPRAAPAPASRAEGMFGVHGTGDTSGSGLRLPGARPRQPPLRRLLRRARRRAGHLPRAAGSRAAPSSADRPRRDHVLRPPRAHPRALPHLPRRARPAVRAVLHPVRGRLRGTRSASGCTWSTT